MPIDPDVALGAWLPESTFSWTSSDVLLYHLAVGAGRRKGDNLDEAALRYTLDDDRLQVLPSFGIVAPTFHKTEPPKVDKPGVQIDLARVVHGSQSIRVHAPIPTSGSATLRTQIVDIWDKGKAAVIVEEGTATDADGNELWTTTSSIFARGEGGWGGDRGPSSTFALPERGPDAVSEYAVTPEQALLYRLCGDRNPLHADPASSIASGFPVPILHGLCSYGIVLREVTDLLLGSDAARVGGFSARFAGVVLPGDALRVEAWSEGEQILVRATTVSDDERNGNPVLSECFLELA